MIKGRVEWWSKEGYGFIELDDNESLFVHLKNADRHHIVKENTLIEFTIEKKNGLNILCLHPSQEN
jgi:cold shock CspA family protein